MKTFSINVSVPSRGDWGVLLEYKTRLKNKLQFPSPPEVTGGSYLLKMQRLLPIAYCFRPLSRRLGVLTLSACVN